MKIHKATKKDLKEVSKIFLIETAKKPYHQTWNKRTALEKIKELFHKGDIYVVIIEKKIIGFIAMITNLGSRGMEAHIEELWLKSAYQGQGIGKTLMKFIEDKYRNKKTISLALISDKRSKAFKFYKKLEYKAYNDYALMGKKLK